MNTIFESELSQISRREFLKLGGTGLLAMFLLPFSKISSRLTPGLEIEPPLTNHGRIVNNQVEVFDRPSFSGKRLKMYYQDLVLPITRVTLGDEVPVYNRIWYELNGEGYVHSGLVQPVEIRHNSSVDSIAKGGQLVEVTVPFTDAVWEPSRPKDAAYRLYYGTAHWAIKAVKDKGGLIWYQLFDDLWDMTYYVNSSHVHILTAEELDPISPHVPEKAKRVEVNLENQVMICYEDQKPVMMSRIASGALLIDGNFSTTKGRFYTSYKRPFRHMATNFHQALPGFDLPGVPWVCFITKSGISFHGTYWHNDFGRPRSHGCINLSTPVAQWLYRWTLPEVPLNEMLWVEYSGTIVDIF